MRALAARAPALCSGARVTPGVAFALGSSQLNLLFHRLWQGFLAPWVLEHSALEELIPWTKPLLLKHLTYPMFLTGLAPRAPNQGRGQRQRGQEKYLDTKPGHQASTHGKWDNRGECRAGASWSHQERYRGGQKEVHTEKRALENKHQPPRLATVEGAASVGTWGDLCLPAPLESTF